MKKFQDKLSALMNCPRCRTPDIFKHSKVLESDLDIKVFNNVKDFISLKKKQKDTELREKFKSLHWSPERELKNLICKENEL